MIETKVALVGLGTVGTGVARLLMSHRERIARQLGHQLTLTRIVAQNMRKPRGLTLPAGMLTDDLTRVTDDPEIRVVAHLIGGLEPARTIMLKLLESGKDVVTANKALLAEHGSELFDKARQLGRSIAFEASVAGGIPIVANIAQCLSANQIESLHGILNGTSNFILTEMENKKDSYAAALAQAQQLGYAEADPTMDVDGTDAAQKLAILADLAFGARIAWNRIPRQGIDRLEVTDIQYARELGYRIKLLAIARIDSNRLVASVGPTLVRLGTPLAEVRGAYNAITIVGDAVGSVFFHGLGAGEMPTASAVAADIIDTVVGRTAITFRTLQFGCERPGGLLPADDSMIYGRYYLRLSAEDHPGVMAEVAGILGRHEISIASVLQHEGDGQSEDVVPLVIMTHETSEQAMGRAWEEINRLECVRGEGIRMRVWQ